MNGPRATPPPLLVLGGSFDPPHLGHLLAALDAREAFGLESVTLCPAAHAPLRAHAPLASPDQRLAMLQALCAAYPWLVLDDTELHAPGPSYTIDTVRRLRATHPDRPIGWIIGSDHLQTLAQWQDAQTLFRLAFFVCLHRPGYPPTPPDTLAGADLRTLAGHTLDLSSTEIRRRLHNGQDCSFFLPPPVNTYIQKHQLYRTPS